MHREAGSGKPNQLRSMHRLTLIAISIGLFSAAGCYDGDALVQRVRDRSIRTRLEEVDLGEFRVTLPRDEVSSK